MRTMESTATPAALIGPPRLLRLGGFAPWPLRKQPEEFLSVVADHTGPDVLRDPFKIAVDYLPRVGAKSPRCAWQ
jgi:hypothetical protein